MCLEKWFGKHFALVPFCLFARLLACVFIFFICPIQQKWVEDGGDEEEEDEEEEFIPLQIANL